MGINKPYHRNFRGFVERPNSGYSQWAYIVDREYSQFPEHYTRAFGIIQTDLIKLFEYIEPSDQNLDTYSYRIHELLMRTCIDVEANFKAILKENIYNPKKGNGDPKPESNWNINDYKIVNKTHRLSAYKIHVPIWGGVLSVYEPYRAWQGTQGLSWYQAYNKSKHDRQNQFKEANLRNLMDAISGLLVLLSSQFRTENFSPGESALSIRSNGYYSGQSALGGFFQIEFPDD